MSWIAKRYTFKPNTWFKDSTGRLFSADEIRNEFDAIPFVKTQREIFSAGFDMAWRQLKAGINSADDNTAILAQLRNIAARNLTKLGNDQSRIEGPAAVKHFLSKAFGAENVHTRMMKLFWDPTLPMDPKLRGRSWADTEKLPIPPGTEIHIRIQVNENTGQEVVMMNPKASYLLYRDFDGDQVSVTTFEANFNAWLMRKTEEMKQRVGNGNISLGGFVTKFPAHSPNLTYVIHYDKQDPHKILRGIKEVGPNHPVFKGISKDLEYYFTNTKENQVKAFTKMWEIGARDTVVGIGTNQVNVTNLIAFKDFLARLARDNPDKYAQLMEDDNALTGAFALFDPLRDKGLVAMAIENLGLNQKGTASSPMYHQLQAMIAHDYALDEVFGKSTSQRKNFEQLPLEVQAAVIANEALLPREQLARRLIGAFRPDEMFFKRSYDIKKDVRTPIHDASPRAREFYQQFTKTRKSLDERFSFLELHTIDGVDGKLVTFRDPSGRSTNARFRNIQHGIYLPIRRRLNEFGEVVEDRPEQYLEEILASVFTKKGIGLESNRLFGESENITAGYIFDHNNILIKAATTIGTDPATLRNTLRANPNDKQFIAYIMGAADNADRAYVYREAMNEAKKTIGAIGISDVVAQIEGRLALTPETNVMRFKHLRLLDLQQNYGVYGENNINSALGVVNELNSNRDLDKVLVGTLMMRNLDREGLRFGIGLLGTLHGEKPFIGDYLTINNQSATMKTLKQLTNSPLVKARLVLTDMKDFQPELAESIYKQYGESSVNRVFDASEGFLGVSSGVASSWEAKLRRTLQMPTKAENGIEYEGEHYTFNKELGKWLSTNGAIKDQGLAFSFDSNENIIFQGIGGAKDKGLMDVLADIAGTSESAKQAFNAYMKNDSTENLNRLLAHREEKVFEFSKDGINYKHRSRLWMDIQVGRSLTSTETAITEETESVIRRYQGTAIIDQLRPMARMWVEQGLDEGIINNLVEHVGQTLQEAVVAGMDPATLFLDSGEEIDGRKIVAAGLERYQAGYAERMAAVEGRLIGGVESASHLSPILKEAFAKLGEVFKGIVSK